VFADQTQSQDIGGQPYTVRFIQGKDYSAPGSPGVAGVGDDGTFSLNVTDQAVPEPSSIVLVALGGLAVLAVSRAGSTGQSNRINSEDAFQAS
jgi:hypothetical protein